MSSVVLKAKRKHTYNMQQKYFIYLYFWLISILFLTLERNEVKKENYKNKSLGLDKEYQQK